MQHLPQGVKDQEGCFVYQYRADPPDGCIAVRSDLSVGDECQTMRQFRYGEMVSIDKIHYSREPGSNNGPFLRLSDGSGWVFQHKFGEKLMRSIPVVVGLWSFWVDNVPAGIALRYHPIDRSDIKMKHVSYKPMQKIFCDRKVIHPITGVMFYRVQGTEGWVFDRRIANNPHTMEDDRMMLLDELNIKKGFFVYKVTNARGIRIRNCPNVGDSSKIDLTVYQNEMVTVDVIRQSPFNHGNGPFLRLLDGSGWLFETKHDEQIMERVNVEEGSWRLKVLHEPVGLALRRHPIDNAMFRDDSTIYKPGDTVECTHMVSSDQIDDVKFYRVKHTNGWIFDKRNDTPMLQLLPSRWFAPPLGSHSISSPQHNGATGWTPDFVRGVAATIEGIEEISFNETSKVLSFRATAAENARINVYYSTKTIGTVLSHPTQGPTQMFRRDCSTDELVQILKNPRLHTGKGYKRRRHSSSLSPYSNSPSFDHNGNNGSAIAARSEQLIEVVETEHGRGVLADVEDEYRNSLLEFDREMENIQKKKMEVLRRVRSIDLKRLEEANDYQEQFDKCQEEYNIREQKQKAEVEAQKLQRELEAQKQRELQEIKERVERMLRERTCFICDRVFSDAHAKNQHHEAVHVIRCHVCGRTFVNGNALNQHKNATGHW